MTVICVMFVLMYTGLIIENNWEIQYGNSNIYKPYDRDSNAMLYLSYSTFRQFRCCKHINY